MEAGADARSGSQAVNGSRANGNTWTDRVREWHSLLAIVAAGLLIFSALSGLSIWLLPFSLANQVTVLMHTFIGLVFLLPTGWYLVRHWRRYWRKPFSHIQLLGYVGAGAALLCLLSGAVLTFQAALRTKINYGWDAVHIVTTFAILAFVLPHVVLIVLRDRRTGELSENSGIAKAARHYGKASVVLALGCAILVALGWYVYTPVRPHNEFPSDYSFKYGKDRPFAPSLVSTASGQAMDERLLAGSRSCGTGRCHEQIVQEWEVSAHRYSAMDVGFQAVQKAMAQQNGPESTRY